MTTVNKRDRLISSAAELFHRQGLAATSLADIAKDADIPIGNVYYYFKTKDELAQAAVDKQKNGLLEVCAQLEAHIEDPRRRLIEVIGAFDQLKTEYTRHGCPIYRLVMDGGKLNEDSVAAAAADTYRVFTAWLEKQFTLLGQEENAKAYAYSLLAGIQGGALLAKSFEDEAILTNELDRLREWLLSIPNKKIFLGKAGAHRIAS